jgi:hypothetical protein
MEKKPNLHGKKVRHGLAWSAKGKKVTIALEKKEIVTDSVMVMDSKF